MIRVLLDTDHVSLHERGYLPLRARLASLPPEEEGKEGSRQKAT